jgi:hypothetical protein
VASAYARRIALAYSVLLMDSEPPKNTHGGKRPGAGRPRLTPAATSSSKSAKSRTLGNPLRLAPHLERARASGSCLTIAPIFRQYNTNNPVPLGNSTTLPPTNRPSFWSTLGASRSEAAVPENAAIRTGHGFSETAPNNIGTLMLYLLISLLLIPIAAELQHLSPNEFAQLNKDLEYIDENDEHGDIASGDTIIDASLVDEVRGGVDATTDNEEAEIWESPEVDTEEKCELNKQLRSLQRRIIQEIKTYKAPLCYLRGDFFDRPFHPVFSLQRDMAGDPTALYWRKVFIWLPHLLPGCPDKFRCDCGNFLSRNGMYSSP